MKYICIIMSIDRAQREVRTPVVRDQEGMLSLIQEFQLVPFFVNIIPGYSVEEHTPQELWFTDENLGPWDWKIECIQSGDVAYGKFLYGGKAAFATVDVYREIINWRRSLPSTNLLQTRRKCLTILKNTAAFPCQMYVS